MRYFCNAHRALLCLAGSRRPAGCCRTAGLPAGCAAFEPHSVIVTTANASRSIQLNAGDTLLVQLEGNSGTGYTWERIEPLAGALQSLGEPQFAPDKNLPGAPGRFTLRYAAVQALPKWIAAKVLVQAGADDADAARRKSLADIRNLAVKKLRLVDRHNSGAGVQALFNLGAAGYRCGFKLAAGM